MTDSKKRQEAFTKIYDEAYWGKDNLSGSGSSIEATIATKTIITDVINKFGIRSIADVACGDFIWMPSLLRELEEPIEYVGSDIVEHLITKVVISKAIC